MFAPIDNFDRENLRSMSNGLEGRFFALRPTARNRNHREAGWTFANSSSEIERRAEALTAKNTKELEVLHWIRIQMDRRTNTPSNGRQSAAFHAILRINPRDHPSVVPPGRLAPIRSERRLPPQLSATADRSVR